MQANWSKPFVEYFNNEVHPDVSNSIGWWVLEKLHVYNPYSGVTNQSEGYNTVMKRLQQWKEVPIDLIILSLNELQVYSYNEIQRGLCQMGEYVLLPKYVGSIIIEHNTQMFLLIHLKHYQYKADMAITQGQNL